MARLLVVDDDPLVRQAMVRSLGQHAHTVHSAPSALGALRELSECQPDLVILDLGLPDLDGAQVLGMIRAISDVPILVATARNKEREMIALLNAGADDYLVKPFSADYLLARVTALLRRAGGTEESDLEVGALLISPSRREARLSGTLLDLSRREYDLLHYLVQRRGRVVSRRELLDQVWRQAYLDDQTIDVHVSWLRRKLGETAREPRYIRTVRGVGIMLDVPEE